MRFETLTARAFGPFRDRPFTFAPGLTVVYGPNESGKSSLHAALYAALCGVRRARGAPLARDREFERRHRPWEGDGWKVALRLRLEDGRTVELVQDLDGQSTSSATDAAMGRDYTGEILNEGAPDGSRWLGLDRRAFLATACVRQTQLLKVLEAPEVLQEHLQRAVATTGADSTAAGAIERINAYQRDNVGQDRANSTKPLRRAICAVTRARDALDQARREHDVFLELSVAEDTRRQEMATASRRLQLLLAARATDAHRKADTDLKRARELSACYPDGKPAGLVEDDELAQEVTRALQGWKTRPALVELEGQSAAELQQELAALPTADAGDLEPAPEVLAEEIEYRSARRSSETHSRQRPAEPVPPQTGGATVAELGRLTEALLKPEPPADAALLRRQEDLQLHLEQLGRKASWHRWLLIAAGVMGAAGLVSLAIKLLVPGVGLLVLGGLGAVVGFWSLARKRDAALAVHDELRQVETQLGETRWRHRDWAQARAEATSRVEALGLSPNPEALRGLARQLETANAARAELDRWRATAAQLSQRFEEHVEKLRSLLGQRGASAGDNLEAAVTDYKSACATRARRHDLTSKLAVRRKWEADAAQAREARATAAQVLRQAASRCGVRGESEDDLAMGLQQWARSRSEVLRQHEKKLAEWTELERLLDGKSLKDLERDVAAKHDEMRRSADKFTPAEINAVPAEERTSPGILASRQEELDRVRGDLAHLQGQIAERQAALPSVAEGEETLELAEQELARVRCLEESLHLARSFLEQAQERVHRDIAPQLAATVRRHLPEVTGGRYRDVRIDPQTLQVQVCDSQGAWREAPLLSHGTAEQIYLLLRVALAERLTRIGENCPLILDEVLVQADGERKRAILELLHGLSGERQVILFTQEDDVSEWADARLNPSRDVLIRLDHPGTGASA